MPLPRLLIKGLPHDNIITRGDTLNLKVVEENVEVSDLTLAIINTEKYKDKFKYALHEFDEVMMTNHTAKISDLPLGAYALVAYGTANGRLIQSYRSDIKVKRARDQMK